MTDDYSYMSLQTSFKKAKFRNTRISGIWGVLCFINAASDNYEVMTTAKILF